MISCVHRIILLYDGILAPTRISRGRFSPGLCRRSGLSVEASYDERHHDLRELELPPIFSEKEEEGPPERRGPVHWAFVCRGDLSGGHLHVQDVVGRASEDGYHRSSSSEA